MSNTNIKTGIRTNKINNSSHKPEPEMAAGCWRRPRDVTSPRRFADDDAILSRDPFPLPVAEAAEVSGSSCSCWFILASSWR